MDTVALCDRRTLGIWQRLRKLPPSRALRVEALDKRQRNQLRCVAWRGGLKIFFQDCDDGVLLLLRPRNTRAPKPAALQDITVDDEGVAFAHAVRRWCETTRVETPTFSQMLKIMLRRGYKRVELGNFDAWLKAGAN